MINRWIGTGRMTKDADIRTNGDTTVARFTVAIDRKYKRGEADFISCVAFGKTAEWMEKYTHKGMKLEIEGRIQTGSYEKDGKKVYTTDIICETVNFAESKKLETPTDDGFVSDVDMSNLPFA